MMKKRRNVHQDGPDPIDIYVGSQLKKARLIAGVSQECLAENLGITFQQVQKYERAYNRISASKLYAISQFLSIPIRKFFPNVEMRALSATPILSGSETNVQAFLLTAEGTELAASFPRIKNPLARQKILELVKIMAND